MSSPIEPVYTRSEGAEPPHIQSLITTLGLESHIEGGYFTETDRDPRIVPSPFEVQLSNTQGLVPQRPGFDAAVRNVSTSIYYLLTPRSPLSGFHINKGRTIFTLHRGRGRYVILHPKEKDEAKRVETFVVGDNVENGERLQWIVEGDSAKAVILLPDKEGQEESRGLLISETVTPGFEYCDHAFLDRESLEELLGRQKAAELSWLLNPEMKK